MPNAFDDVRLPDDIERGAQGGPEFQTTIITLGTGFEQRNADWPSQRCRYDLAYGIQGRADYEALIQFFYARLGRARGFRFKDWADFRGTNVILGTGTGALTTFQLRKTYTSGSVTYNRKITRPVSGTVTVALNGTNQPTGWSVNLATGVITFAVAPGVGVVVTASFEFDVPVRFDMDRLDATLEWSEAAAFNSLSVVELRE